MTKILLITFFGFLLSNCHMHAGDDYAISFEKIPNESKEFISTHFPNIKVSYAKVEKDFFEVI